MKFLSLFLTVFLFLLTLVACGSDADTTPKTTTAPEVTTTAPDTTTTPEVTTTEPEVTTTEPEVEAPESVTLMAVDGALAGGAMNQGTYVNDIGTANVGSITFFLEGNYEGEWNLDVYYLSMMDRSLLIKVNETEYIVNCSSGATWDNIDLAAIASTTIEMINGENIIEISAATEWAPNLYKFELARPSEKPEEDSTKFVLDADNATVTPGAKITRLATGTYMENFSNTNGGSASFTLNGDYAGTWTMDIYYMTMMERSFSLTINGTEQVIACATTPSWGNATEAGVMTIIVELVNGENAIVFAAATEWAPNLYKAELYQPEAE